MIQLIDKTQKRDEIIALWQEAFGDKEEYIAFFLDNCASECLGYSENGRLVSMLFLLNGSIGDFNVKYIYAACTSSEFRGRGIMGELIEAAKVRCRESNFDGIFLVPAGERLYDYYARFGFVSRFKKALIEFENSSLNYDKLTELTDIHEVVRVRNKLLKGYDCFKFDDKTVLYSVKEHLLNGGKVYTSVSDEIEILLFAYKNDNEFIIKELLFPQNMNFLKILTFCLNKGKENVYIQCPIVYNNTDKMAKYAKCGMYYPLTEEMKESSVEKNFYAGLYLD